MSAAEQGASQAIDAWYGAISALDFKAMEDLWDRNFEQLVYQPQEHVRPLTTWEAILAYWRDEWYMVEALPRWRELEREIVVLGSAAAVYTRFDTSIQITDFERPFDGEMRFSNVLHQVDDRWLLVHHHESRIVSLEMIESELSA
jgi:ketosteroid isomerase-like protein